MKKLTIPFIAIGIAAVTLVSCKKTGSTPVTSTTLDFSAVDKVLNDSVPVKCNGYCYALITVNGKPAYAKGWGGYDANTRLLIASCSKWLSAGVLMSLVDDGKIKLTDTVGKYLPAFTTYGKGNITIAQLFSHTSGLPSNSTQGYESSLTLTLAQAADSVAKNVALINVPGADFNYGGVSMQVAGRICEVAGGKPWDTLFAQRIATPCGMTNTDFGLTSNPGIAGGARSTPNDYTAYLIMIMNKGLSASGTRVLSEAAITSMEQSQIGNASIYYTPYPASYFTTTGIYGIGNWRDLTGPGDVLIENSSPGLYGSHPWVDRNKKVTGFIFTYILINGYLATMPTSLNVRSLVRTIVQ